MAEKILDGNVDEVRDAVSAGIESGEIGIPELQGLLDAEAVSKKRQGVIAFLGDKLQVLQDALLPAGDQDPETDQDAGDKAERGEEVKTQEWKKPEYSGGLTGEQAMWRNTHLDSKGISTK